MMLAWPSCGGRGGGFERSEQTLVFCGSVRVSLRFQRRIQVFPGVRLNVGLRGVSTSLGVPGASLTVGKRGVHANLGAPGTGLSYRTRIDGAAGDRSASCITGSGVAAGRDAFRAASAGALCGETPFRLHLHEDGTVDVFDDEGHRLSPWTVRAVREQQGGRIGAWLQQQCDAINAELAAISDIHLLCPDPGQAPEYSAVEFVEPPPPEPAVRFPGLFERLFPPARSRIGARNAAVRATWERKMSRWRECKARFEREERERRRWFERVRRGSVAEMSDFFQHRVEALEWPRETLIGFRIENSGNVMFFDVDLPDVEDMPRREARVPGQGLRLSIRSLSDARNRRNYARHIHGVLFRIIGECFASFPRMRRVIGSGFSQRVRSATGTVAEEYLISVSVDRRHWSRIDFRALERVDPVWALAQFDLRRRMTKAGVFTAIEPFTASSRA